MQFKHPELLYALFLLLIPIIIHLFQLRKFQKTEFTNVAFLKKVSIQTRKSSQLKKWLTLLLRMAAIACLVIAFAQPFIASKTALNADKETVIYLDNSYSMQLKGSDGPLLQRAIQSVYNVPDTKGLSYFTNNNVFTNLDEKTFKSEILKTDYTATQLTPTQVVLKAEQLFTRNNAADKRLIYISDFQLKEQFPAVPDDFAVNAVALTPAKRNNISIDSAYIAGKDASKSKLKVIITAQGDVPQTVPVSLFNKGLLLAKTAVTFEENNTVTAEFDVENNTAIDGRIVINDPNLLYDNTLFFSINTAKKINVLAINEASGAYLKRLFDTADFNYSPQSFKNLDYNAIPQQNLIILNGLTQIPAPLTAALQAFSKNGGSIFIIPNENSVTNEYNNLLSTLSLGQFTENVTSEKQITNIAFDHPLYKNVFEKRVVNFQYPKVNAFFASTLSSGAALSYEDGKPFILQRGAHFLSTASFNTANTNFTSSPLIVPTLYNMALQSLPLPKLYYTIGAKNTLAIPISLQQDQILTLKDSLNSFIPLQNTSANKVTITTEENPEFASTYAIVNDTQFIENTSFNYNRTESQLQYANVEQWEDVTAYDSIEQLFEQIVKDNNITTFWKWFAIAAFLFLIAEMLVLKFYKR